MSLNLNELLSSMEKEVQIEKTASATPAAKPAISAELAGVLEKKASEDLTKQAFAQGEALARELLSKTANDIIEGNNEMVADDNAKVTPNDTNGNVEQVLQSTVDKAVASGATTEDRVNHETQVNNVEPAGGAVGDTEKQAQEENMNKSAQEDKDLVAFIMEKIAQEFSPETTTDAAGVNVEAATAPNKIQADNAHMTAQDDAKVQGIVPGGDGTVNALFETIVAKAKAQGGQSDDLVNGDSHVESRLHGETDMGAEEAVEKAAAVAALCEGGMDFDLAVALVKEAEEALDAEAWEQEKQACLGKLMEAGVDFDSAVALVKEAEEELAKEAGMAGMVGKAKGFLGAAKGKAGSAAAAAKANAQDMMDKAHNVGQSIKTNKGVFNSGTGSSMKALAKNRTAQVIAGTAAAGVAAGGAAAINRGQEKKACLEALMAEGIDFDTAVELTKQAEQEIYGE